VTPSGTFSSGFSVGARPRARGMPFQCWLFGGGLKFNPKPKLAIIQEFLI
jgi:hypothetical protein